MLLIGLVMIRKVVESCYNIREILLQTFLKHIKKPIESIFAELNIVN